MIIKYKDESNWGYIDNLANVVYQKEPNWNNIGMSKQADYEARTSENLSDNLENTQHFFCEYIKDSYKHDVNLKDSDYLISSVWGPLEENDVLVLVCNLRNRVDADKIVLMLNQECYLLNDEGQTIERLN